MLRVVSQHVSQHGAERGKGKTSLERVVFVLYDRVSREIFEQTWAEIERTQEK
jgi:hypothetical protein